MTSILDPTLSNMLELVIRSSEASVSLFTKVPALIIAIVLS